MYSAVHDVVVTGREMRIFSNGTGRPILMLHDLGASAAAFEPLTGAICLAGRELVAIDLPGCGHSDPVPGSDLQEYVDQLLEILPRLGAAPLDLVGRGFGGFLAASIAAARPAWVNRLVLAQPTIPPRSGGPVSARMPVGMALDGALTTLRRGKFRQNLYGFSRARAVLDQLSTPNPSWWEGLRRIAAPTLVLGGPDELLDALASAIPGGVRTRAAAARHLNSTEFAQHCLDFLAAENDTPHSASA